MVRVLPRKLWTLIGKLLYIMKSKFLLIIIFASLFSCKDSNANDGKKLVITKIAALAEMSGQRVTVRGKPSTIVKPQTLELEDGKIELDGVLPANLRKPKEGRMRLVTIEATVKLMPALSIPETESGPDIQTVTRENGKNYFVLTIIYL